MNKIISCFILAGMCCTPVSCTRSDDEVPLKKSLISSFYSTIISSRLMGVPDKKELDTLFPYISKELHSLLVQAGEAEKIYAGRSKEPAPPLIEGSLFVSLFEGPDSFTTITPDGGKEGLFLVGFSIQGNAAGENPFEWKDRVYIIREDGRWVIDDIELLGTWDFSRRGRVKNVLRDAIRIAGANPN